MTVPDRQRDLVESVMWLEEGDGIILRLYEAGKTGSHVNLNFGVPIAAVTETNLLEEKPKDVALEDGRVALYFKPFEIKTLRCVPS